MRIARLPCEIECYVVSALHFCCVIDNLNCINRNMSRLLLFCVWWEKGEYITVYKSLE